MRTSVVTKQGFSHNTCEDYSLCDDNTIVLCDGCSSSKKTEIGSMLLSHAALKIKNIKEGILGSSFGLESIKEAFNCSNLLKIDKDSLTSTLMIATLIDNQIFIRVFGDGVVLLKQKEVITILDYEYANNAPYYLRYELENKERDFDFSCEDIKIFKDSIQVNQSSSSKFQKYPSPIVLEKDKYDEIILFTDGIKTYADSSFKVNARDDLIEFYKLISKEQKNIAGDFSKRRLRMFERSLPKDFKNYDDFSMGIMSFKDEN